MRPISSVHSFTEIALPNTHTALHVHKSFSSQPTTSKWLFPLLTIDHLSILKLSPFSLDRTTRFHPDNECSAVSHPTVRSLLWRLYFLLLIPNENWPPGSTTIPPCSSHFLPWTDPADTLLPLFHCRPKGLQITTQSIWHNTWQHTVRIQFVKIEIINIIVLANPFPFPSTS